jgi:DNA-binding HxlR family transcriptional regulator
MKNKIENFHNHDFCPIRHVLDRLGDKWSILVLITLGGKKEPMRFNEVMHAIGDISQKMLTVTLRMLEADGLITRKQYPEIPPRVEYAITDLGSSLLPHIDGLAGWAAKNMDAISKTRKKFVAKQKVA